MNIKKYTLGKIQIEYLINDKKQISMQIFPQSMLGERKKAWEIERQPFSTRARYQPQWSMGNIAYYHVTGQNQSQPGCTMKHNQNLYFEGQEFIEKDNKKVILTALRSDEGYRIIHTITYTDGFEGLECETEFINGSSNDITLDMLSSFALDNLSPFQSDDAPNTYKFHRFYGGWSMEGKHICQTIEELSLEKTWAGFNGNNEKFGCLGSYPVKRYFPTAVFEDSKAGVMWAVQLAHNCSWQMELTRTEDTLSFSGGLGDRDFCGWRKNLKKGDSFKGPKAYIATVKGDIFDACAAVTDMQKIAQIEYGEKGLPICFNEYCSTWGRPTQNKMLTYCDALKKYGVKYLVIDAGWSKEGCEQDSNGEWNIDKNIFPDMKAMNKYIRENGMIPGIWFEFEVTTRGSKMFEPEYDFMHLKRDGSVIKTGNFRSYWDFRREDVREYLYEKVIKFLKNNDFGYIKVDYNANIGVEVDGDEAGAEELRIHLQHVRDFFIKMKEEIPDLIIENCSSGGHRLEPSMLGVSAVSSFSDAHEAVEAPYIAASLHNLILPAQSLIWAVLREDDTEDRLVYSLAATFLGRACLSGDIDKLSQNQESIVKKALEYYGELENVILNGKTKIYGNRSKCTRYPQGIQVVVRKTQDEILIVYHAFEAPFENVEFEIPDGFSVKNEFYGSCINVKGTNVKITDVKPFTAGSVVLQRK